MSTECTIWIYGGQALVGEFCPAGTATDVDLIKLAVTPPTYPTDELRFFFDSKADMIATAKTLWRITDALERSLYPDWDNIPGGGRWS